VCVEYALWFGARTPNSARRNVIGWWNLNRYTGDEGQQKNKLPVSAHPVELRLVTAYKIG